MNELGSPTKSPSVEFPRRSFLRRFSAAAVGAAAGIVPALVGVASFLNPLRPSVQRKLRPEGFDENGFVKVTSVDSVATGEPVLCSIIADRKDAWNKFTKEPLGAVYVQKLSDGKVRAFNAECPHAGCFVNFIAAKKGFLCPCHNSLFSVEGERSESSPSARNLDSLDCDVRDGDVWVKFEKFKTGTKEKHAL